MPFTPNSFLVKLLLHDNEYQVIGFCDNDASLNGKDFCGIPIYSPENAFSVNPKAYFSFSSSRNDSSICNSSEALMTLPNSSLTIAMSIVGPMLIDRKSVV